MPRRNSRAISETTSKAHEVLERAFGDASTVDEPAMLEALSEAALQLGRLGKGDQEIAVLVERVRSLVATKR